MRFRRVSFPMSALLSIVAIFLYFHPGLNLGIDFRGGTLIEVQSKTGPADLAKMRATLSALNLGDVQLQQFGAPSDVLIRIGEQPGGDEAQRAAIAKVRDALNDTVVIYDRIRENLRRYKRMSMPDLLNSSVNSTLSRSIITHVTVTLALLALLLFGGQAIHSFTATMMFGVVLVGTYTSVFIASPILIYLGVGTARMGATEPEPEPEPERTRAAVPARGAAVPRRAR